MKLITVTQRRRHKEKLMELGLDDVAKELWGKDKGLR